MPLTDAEIKKAKHSREDGKPERLADSGGMYLELSASGGKWWRLKYRFDGKEKRLSLGTYPDTSLKAAREQRDEARRLLANGIDPGALRKIEKSARVERDTHSFESVAWEWLSKNAPTWAESHTSNILRRLERDIFPWLGARPTGDITSTKSAFHEAQRRPGLM